MASVPGVAVFGTVWQSLRKNALRNSGREENKKEGAAGADG
jgi:hypothetical protein